MHTYNHINTCSCAHTHTHAHRHIWIYKHGYQKLLFLSTLGDTHARDILLEKGHFLLFEYLLEANIPKPLVNGKALSSEIHAGGGQPKSVLIILSSLSSFSLKPLVNSFSSFLFSQGSLGLADWEIIGARSIWFLTSENVLQSSEQLGTF